MYTEAICLTSGANKLFEKDETPQVSISSTQLCRCGAEAAVDTCKWSAAVPAKLLVKADGEMTLARRL